MKKSISLILILAAIVGCLSFVSYRSKSFASDLKVAILTADVFDDKQLKSSGITADLIECKGDNFRLRMTEAASSHEMVVCVGRQFWEIGEVSREYPSVKFVWMDNTVENPEDYPNLENVTFYENQGSYLAGYIAAAMTESGVIGIVASEKNSSAARYAAGFIQGAKSVNSSVDIVAAIPDPGYEDGAYKAAMAVMDEGADTIMEVGFGNDMGVYRAAKERGAYVVGTETDRKITLPGYEDLIICSVKKNIGRAIVRLVTRYDDYGQFSGGKNISVGINEGYIDICYGDGKSTQLVDENLVTQIQYLRDSIINNVIVTDFTTNALDNLVEIPQLEIQNDDENGEDGAGTDTETGDGQIVPDK